MACFLAPYGGLPSAQGALVGIAGAGMGFSSSGRLRRASSPRAAVVLFTSNSTTFTNFALMLAILLDAQRLKNVLKK